MLVRQVPGQLGTMIIHRVGKRGGCLLFFAFLDFVYGTSIAFPPKGILLDPSFHYLNGVAPLVVWGSIWIAVGVVCLVGAFLRFDAPSFAAAIMLKIMWGFLTGWAWLAVDTPRGYVGPSLWLAFAGFIGVLSGWDEPPLR